MALLPGASSSSLILSGIIARDRKKAQGPVCTSRGCLNSLSTLLGNFLVAANLARASQERSKWSAWAAKETVGDPYAIVRHHFACPVPRPCYGEL